MSTPQDQLDAHPDDVAAVAAHLRATTGAYHDVSDEDLVSRFIKKFSEPEAQPDAKSAPPPAMADSQPPADAESGERMLVLPNKFSSDRIPTFQPWSKDDILPNETPEATLRRANFKATWQPDDGPRREVGRTGRMSAEEREAEPTGPKAVMPVSAVTKTALDNDGYGAGYTKSALDPGYQPPPPPQETESAQPPPEDVPTFAARIRKKTGVYGDVDDHELVTRIVAKYPEYASRVKMDAKGTATVRDDADFSEEIKAQGETLARTNKPEGKAIDISRGDLLPERGVRVTIPVYNEDTPETLLQRGMELTSKHLGLRGADAEAATKEALDYLNLQGVKYARRAGTDEPISKEDLDAYKLKGVTTFDSSHPGLKPIFDRYIEQGKTGPGSGQTPNELINSRQLRKEVERLPPVMQGYVSSLGSVNHDIGGAMAIGGMEHADEFIESADAGGSVAEEVMRESPDQSVSANLQRGLGRAVPQAAEMMSLQQTGAALPIMGALKHGGEGKAAMLEGAVEGAAMQAGMHGTSALGLGRAGNAALWTIVPTAQGINAGKSASQALGDALPFGLMAGMEGGKGTEEPLTLGRLVEHAEAAHVERASAEARPGVVGNADGTITVTVPATDGSGHLEVTVRPSFSKAQALRSAAAMRVKLTRLEAGTMTEGEKQGLVEFYGVGDEKHLAQFFRDRVDELKSHAFGSETEQPASETRATNAPEDVGQAQASGASSSAPAVNDGEWQPFPAESGTLNIPRASMPQIRSEHRGAMVQFLKGRGITHSQEEVIPSALKPSQAEYSPEKVERARDFEGDQRSILVSSDDHVLDGHHQWLSSLADAPHKPIPAIRLHAPAHQLLIEAARFPSSGVDEASGATSSNASREGQQSVAPPRAASPSSSSSKYDALMEVSHAFDAHDTNAVDAAYERAARAGASDLEIRAAMVGDFSSEPSPLRRAGATALEVWNATRAVKASFDFSAPRNSLILTLTRPIKAARAFGQSIKAFGSESAAQRYREAIESDPLKRVADESGLDITDSSGPLAQHEEMFRSELAEKIPGVQASERAFHQYLNSLRFSTFKDYALTHPAAGPEDLAGVARAINFFSGRGSFGPLENTKVVQGLSTAFYAPRLTASYVQSLASPFMGTPAARRFAARHVVQAVGTGVAMGALIKLTSKQTGVDFEADPRSSDFGKIKAGDYRFNLFGGYSALARYVAQGLMGKRKTASGAIEPKSRVDTALTYARTRLHPSLGFFIDLKTGRAVDGTKFYRDGKLDKAAAARDLIMPLSAGDIERAIYKDGLKGGVITLPSLAGFDVSIRDSTKKAKEQK